MGDVTGGIRGETLSFQVFADLVTRGLIPAEYSTCESYQRLTRLGWISRHEMDGVISYGKGLVRNFWFEIHKRIVETIANTE